MDIIYETKTALNGVNKNSDDRTFNVKNSNISSCDEQCFYIPLNKYTIQK